MRKYYFLTYIIAFMFLLIEVIFIYDRESNSQVNHYKNQVAVLEYHHIDPTASAYTITPETFKQQLQALKNNHYQIISMDQFVKFLKGQALVPPNAVVITFDDGYESFYKYAYPILKDENMVATNFLIVNYLGTNPGISFLHWDEIMEMKKDGFGFYSHTFHTHDFVTGPKGKTINPLTDPVFIKDQNRMETEEEYRQRVTSDLEKAKQILQNKLGDQEGELFCLPHGRYNSELLTIAHQVGIQYIFTGIDGLNKSGDTLIKRINAGSSYITPEKLINRLNDETTLKGKLKILLKNFIERQRNSE